MPAYRVGESTGPWNFVKKFFRIKFWYLPSLYNYIEGKLQIKLIQKSLLIKIQGSVLYCTLLYVLWNPWLTWSLVDKISPGFPKMTNIYTAVTLLRLPLNHLDMSICCIDFTSLCVLLDEKKKNIIILPPTQTLM